MLKSFSTYKILGTSLIVIAVIGYFTVADEFRHVGELIGVSSILLSGIILLIGESEWTVAKKLSLKWVSLFILVSIPFGGVLLDNMPLGIGIGISVGLLFSYLLRKKN